MRRTLWVLIAAAILAALALAVPASRRILRNGWLLVGDLLVGSATERLEEGDLLIFDPADAADRAALKVTHGAPRASLSSGRLHIESGAQVGPHELCTRRLPADWSGWKVLRLEVANARGGTPAQALKLSLRWRGRTGWPGPRWYWPRVYLGAERRLLELDLAAGDAFIERTRVRQLCIGLEAGAPAAVELGSVHLSRRWRAEGTRAPGEAISFALVDETRKVPRSGPPPASIGDERGLALEAARNEVLGFQLLIRRGAAGPSRASLQLRAPRGPGGREVPARIFAEDAALVREGSSAMYGPGLLSPGWIPDRLWPLDGGSSLELATGNQLFLVELHVPEGAPAGSYSGELAVSAGARSFRRELRLEVHAATLPRPRQLVMVYYLPQLLREAVGLERGEAALRLELSAMRLVQAHGAYLVTTPAPSRLHEYLPALRGSLFSDGPSAGEPLPYWPIDLGVTDEAGVKRVATEVMRWFQANAPRTQPFVYLADEPDSLEAYQEIRRKAAWIHSAPSPGDRLPVMVTESVRPRQAGWPSLVGSVDYWVSPESFPEAADRRRVASKGRERFFTYNGAEPGAGSQLLDADGVAPRTWGWIAFRFGIDLWFLWQGAYYRDIYNGGGRRFSLEDPRSYDRRLQGRAAEWGSGDGVLVYPPLRPGGDPLPSLRLKLIRRGVQDLLLLQLAERCGRGSEARALARALVPRALNECPTCPTSWPKDPAPWEAARLRLLRLVSTCNR